MISGIRAPLRLLQLQSDPCYWPYSTWWDPVTLKRQVLFHHVLTLEKLELDKFTFDPSKMGALQGNATAPSISSMRQFPSLRSLTVDCVVGRPRLGCLQHLFPALHGTLSLGFLEHQQLDPPYADLRSLNKLTQDDDGASSRPKAWKRLGRLVYDPVLLYTLGLYCPTRPVMLHEVNAETRTYASDAMRENPVLRLTASLKLNRGLHVLDGLFPTELAGTLTHLTLALDFATESRREAGVVAGTLAHIRRNDLLVRASTSRLAL